jgi:hypothetical protein
MSGKIFADFPSHSEQNPAAQNQINNHFNDRQPLEEHAIRVQRSIAFGARVVALMKHTPKASPVRLVR